MATKHWGRVVASASWVLLGVGLGVGGTLTVLWITGAFETVEAVVEVEAPRPLKDWTTGDVHTHAVGDAPLVDHPGCRRPNGQELTSSDCARQLVELMLEAAQRNGLDWLILSEHGPWLGVPGLTRIGKYDFDQAQRHWNLIRTAANDLSVLAGVRALMGEELGSAPPFSFTGHFNAYQIDDYVRNTTAAVADTKYIEAVSDGGGFGGINHPFQGGNGWDCWYPSSTWASNPLGFPRHGCEFGASDFAPTPFDDDLGRGGLVAMEITNGGVFPPPGTVEQWDALLQQGYRIWAVGASDAHTLSRGADSWAHGIKGRLGGERRLGSSRTFVFVPDYPKPAEGYDSTDQEDPIRHAIVAGRTVASNAGFATAQVADALPGGTLKVAETGDVAIEVLVRWETEFTPGGRGPNSIRLVLSQYGPECATIRCEQIVDARCIADGCVPGEERLTPSMVGAEHEQVLTSVILPDGWNRAYVRVEVLEGESEQPPRYGAFASPVFVERVA
jgi:hypothetical protein